MAAVPRPRERGLSRPAAPAEMLHHYCDFMHSNDPVHTWRTSTEAQTLASRVTSMLPRVAFE